MGTECKREGLVGEDDVALECQSAGTKTMLPESGLDPTCLHVKVEPMDHSPFNPVALPEA